MSEDVVLNQSALDRLSEWGGDKLLGQMIRLFLANAPARMEQIRAGAPGPDHSESEKGAHSLKSSAANVGAEKVRTVAAEIERTVNAGEGHQVRELLPTLESAFAEAVAALQTVERGLPQ